MLKWRFYNHNGASFLKLNNSVLNLCTVLIFFSNFHTQFFYDRKIRMIAFQLRNYTIYIYLLYISRRNLDATTEGRLLKNFNIDMKYQQKYRGSKALLWTDVAGKFSEMGVEKRRPSPNSIKRFSPPFSLPLFRFVSPPVCVPFP